MGCERGVVVSHRGNRSLTSRIVAGSLLLTLTLTPLAPAFARPTVMVHCTPVSATVDSGRTHAMPCHAGDMTDCSHALTCLVGPAAILPTPIQVRLVQSRSTAPLPLLPSWPGRLGFRPPTPPPNR
jgi:hypothetical protein